jgi:tRNA pseudouridine55 synthase
MPEYHFREGEVLLVDKPLGWTSFDVVNKLRYKITDLYRPEFKRIKVGHAGTLDPLATGLLIVCTGQKTKQTDQYQQKEKTYTGTIELGKTTPSYDKETAPDQTYKTDHITEESIRRVAKKFIGKQMQHPPVFSARKIEGKRAYRYARNREEVKIEPREIEITSFEITAIHMPFINFKVTCSKGTYIRSLAHDFSKALNSGGYLTALRRTRIGEFSVADASSVETWVERIERMSDEKSQNHL